MTEPATLPGGPHLKGVLKRREILDTALELIAEHGYSNLSLQQIADATKLTKAGLLYHFGTRENLFVEILRRRDQRDSAANPQTPPEGLRLMRIARHNNEVPGLVELYSALLQEGVDPQNAAHGYFTERYATVQDRVASDIQHAIDHSELPAGVDKEFLARILVAVADGLQLRWQYDRSVDPAAHLEYLWRLLQAKAGA
jgi:AcrR family transcriptional regulator